MWSFLTNLSEININNEIILLILCILAKEDHIDLQNKDLKKGESYFRLVLFCYRNTQLQKGLDLTIMLLKMLLTNLDKIAWKILKQGTAFLKWSEVIDEVGEDAFEYGVIVGHEDYRLIGKETSDVFVTFVQRTLLDFFGSFYFVLQLVKGKN